MKLSVWMSAYNHNRFIAEAIEGVLMQKTDFDVEIVIGEDCSTDSTRQIILDYNKKYPGKFKLLLPEKNLGMIPMFISTYPLCNGDYVAWLDGDDYWTDPLKLQKQVDFLQKHSEFVMCFHNVIQQNEMDHTVVIKELPYPMNPDHSLMVNHFCSHNPVSACSVVYRNILPDNLPEWFSALPFPDLAFYFLLAEKGKIQFMDEVMGVYRLHGKGEWSGSSRYENYRKLVSFYDEIQEYFPEYKETIKTGSLPVNETLLYLSMDQQKFSEARKLYLKILRTNAIFWRNKKGEMLRLFASLFIKHIGK